MGRASREYRYIPKYPHALPASTILGFRAAGSESHLNLGMGAGVGFGLSASDWQSFVLDFLYVVYYTVYS